MLGAHLAARDGDDLRACERWARAGELATRSGLRFDAAVIALERAEHDGAGRDRALAGAVQTFEALRAEPWRKRATRAQMSEQTAPEMSKQTAPGRLDP